MRIYFFLFLLFSCLSAYSQQPNAAAFDKALNSLKPDSKSLAQFLINNESFNANGDYRFYPNEKYSDIIERVKSGDKLIEVKDISNIYI